MARRKKQEDIVPDCGPPEDEDYANLIVMERTRFIHYEFAIDGFRYRGSTRKETKPEAAAVVRHKRKVAEAERLLHRERRAPDGQLEDMTLKAASERYMREVGAHHARPSNARRVLNRLQEYLGAGTLLSQVTDERVSEMVAALRERRRRGDPKAKPLSPSYVDMHVERLQSLFRVARGKWGLALRREPDWTQHRKKRLPRRRELTFEEQVRIGRAMPPDYQDAYWFLTFSGLRRTGGVQLRWREVDFPAGLIRLKVKGGKPVQVPISDEIEAILRAQEGRDGEFVFTFRATRDMPRTRGGKVLAHEAGKRYPMRSGTFYQAFRKAARAEGIEDVRPHDLRKMMGNHTFQATGDIVAAQERLHHAKLQTTREDYLYVTTAQTWKAVTTTNAYVTEGLAKARAELARREMGRAGARALADGGLDCGTVPEESPKGMRNACAANTLPSTFSTWCRNSPSKTDVFEGDLRSSLNYRQRSCFPDTQTSGSEITADGGFHERGRNQPLRDANPRSFPEVSGALGGIDAGALGAGETVTHQGVRGRFKEIQRRVACRLDEAFEPTPMERLRKAGHTVWAFEPEDGSASDTVVVVGDRGRLAIRAGSA